MKIIKMDKNESLLLERAWYEYTGTKDVFALALSLNKDKAKEYWDLALTKYVIYSILKTNILGKYHIKENAYFNFYDNQIEVYN